LERNDQLSPKSALVAPIEDAATKCRHLVELVGDAAEKRSRMASLLSQLSARKAALARAIEDACEMQERCRLTTDAPEWNRTFLGLIAIGAASALNGFKSAPSSSFESFAC
jgi:hypothetical protein